MAIQPTQAITVGTTATRLDAVPGNANGFHGVAQGAGTLVLGGSSSLTANSGCRQPVVAGTTIDLDMNQGDELWAIVASGSIIVDTLVTGV